MTQGQEYHCLENYSSGLFLKPTQGHFPRESLSVTKCDASRLKLLPVSLIC